jgi:hypothetical protein
MEMCPDGANWDSPVPGSITPNQQPGYFQPNDNEIYQAFDDMPITANEPLDLPEERGESNVSY